MSTQNATTVVIDNTIDVRARIAQLREWKREYDTEDQRLAEQATQLSDKRHADINLANQIATMRTRLRLHMVQEPLEISKSPSLLSQPLAIPPYDSTSPSNLWA